MLTVTANSNENSVLTANGYVPKLSKTLNPFQSVNFGANDVNHIGGKGISNLQVTFEVFDPNISTSNTVASFTAGLNYEHLMEGPWPIVTNPNSGQGYSLSNPILNQGADQDEYPAAAQIAICWTGS